MSGGDRLRIAVQKSGRLTDNSLAMFQRCGLQFTRDRDHLMCVGENLPVDLLLVRDDDIPGLLADGSCQAGIAGMNVLEESRLARGEPAGFDALVLEARVPAPADELPPAGRPTASRRRARRRRSGDGIGSTFSHRCGYAQVPPRRVQLAPGPVRRRAAGRSRPRGARPGGRGRCGCRPRPGP